MPVPRVSHSSPSKNGKAFVLAHLSDPHLTGLHAVRARDLLNKRMLGYRSWQRHRRHEHRPEVLAALISDLKSCAPDHVVITGDMTHLGTPSECREVADWLRAVGAPSNVTVVPGNHDRYVCEPWDETLALWLPYMASDNLPDHAVEQAAAQTFPSLRVRADIALIGVSSARPSAPLLAVGSMGRRQIQELEGVLGEAGSRGLCRVLLIHHPPVPGTVTWRKRLTDSRELARVVARQGVEMVLHGHTHRSCRSWLSTPWGSAPVIGVRSASSVGRKPGRRAQYHIHHITRGPQGWRMKLSVREYAPDHGNFVLMEEWQVILGGESSVRASSDLAE